MPKSSKPTAAGDVFAKTVPLVIEKHYWGETKEGNLAKVQTKANKAYLSLRKRLLVAPELSAIRTRDYNFYQYLRSYATPFRPGFWLVALAMVEEVRAAAERWETERGLLADAAASAFPGHVETMPDVLKDQFNRKDYPSAQRFRDAFWVEWRFVNLGVPDVLREVRAEVFREEREKAQRLAAEARSTVERHLVTILHEVTTHAAELLQPRANGTRPSLREGCLDRLTRFLATAEAQNVTNSEEARDLIRRVRDIGRGLTVRMLKDDDDLRARTQSALATAAAAIAEAVEEQPERAIRIREEVA